MNRSLYGIALLGLATALAPCDGRAQDERDPEATPPGTFDLFGMVLEAGTERPVELALVEATEVGRRTLTDSAGRFVFRDLPEGSHTFRTGSLGYVENVETSDVGRGNALIVRLMPKPMAVEGIHVIVSSLERRRNRVASRSEVLRRGDLAATVASTIGEVLRSRHGVAVVDCPNADLRRCVRDRGRARPVHVWLDEHPVAGGPSVLELYSPHEIERLEYYPGLGQIRLYTARFLEELGRTGRSLMPICVVCG